MKRILKSLAAIIGIAALAGCADEDYILTDHYPSESSNYFSLSNSYFTFPYYGSTESFNFTCENLSYSFDAVPEWLTLEAASNEYSDDPYYAYSSHYYNLTALQNYEAVSRTGIFDLKLTPKDSPQYAYTQTMTAEQNGRGYYIGFVDTDLSLLYVNNVSAASSTIQVKLHSNCPTISVSASIEGVTYSYDYTAPTLESDIQTLTLTVPTNPSISGRTFKVYITAEEIYSNRTVNISQNGIEMNVSTTEYSFSAAGGSNDINVTSDVEWTITAPVATWCTATKNGSKITVQAVANLSDARRTTSFNIKVGDVVVKTIQINQAAPSITVTPATVELDYRPGSTTVTVVSDVDWDEATPSQAWLSVNKTSGKAGKTEVVISTTENAAVNSRTGKVTFTRQGWSRKAEVTVTQTAFVPEMSANNFVFEREGGSRTLEINTPGTWYINTEGEWPEWLTVDPRGGERNATVTLTATNNTTDSERHANLYILFGGVKQEALTITQRGPYIDVNSTNLEFNVFGGSSLVSYSANVEVNFTVEPAADWVTLENVNQGEVRVTTPYNNSVTPRSTYLVISPAEGDLTPKRVPISQQARTVEVSTTAVNMFYSAATTQKYTVTADGETSIGWLEQPEWATLRVTTITEPSNGTRGIWEFEIEVAENPTEQTRRATLVVSLQDLPSGQAKTVTIPVSQYGRGVVLEKVDWAADENWNATSNYDINLNINNNWGDDENWN